MHALPSGRSHNRAQSRQTRSSAAMDEPGRTCPDWGLTSSPGEKQHPPCPAERTGGLRWPLCTQCVPCEVFPAGVSWLDTHPLDHRCLQEPGFQGTTKPTPRPRQHPEIPSCTKGFTSEHRRLPPWNGLTGTASSLSGASGSSLQLAKALAQDLVVYFLPLTLRAG